MAKLNNMDPTYGATAGASIDPLSLYDRFNAWRKSKEKLKFRKYIKILEVKYKLRLSDEQKEEIFNVLKSNNLLLEDKKRIIGSFSSLLIDPNLNLK